MELNYSELESVINNPKENPFKRIATNKTLPIIAAKTLETDNKKIEDLTLYNQRAEAIHANEAFKEKVLDIYNSVEFTNKPKLYIEEQIYSNGFPSAIEKDRLQNFHSALTYEEKLNVMASFDDERYKEFGRRIFAQEYTHQVDQANLIKLKELYLC